MKQLPKVDGKYGAPMGRNTINEHTEADGAMRLHVRKMRLDRGGYDSGGAYWGLRPRGVSIYWYYTDEGSVSSYVDAMSHTDAVRQIRAMYPEAKFYR